MKIEDIAPKDSYLKPTSKNLDKNKYINNKGINYIKLSFRKAVETNFFRFSFINIKKCIFSTLNAVSKLSAKNIQNKM